MQPLSGNNLQGNQSIEKQRLEHITAIKLTYLWLLVTLPTYFALYIIDTKSCLQTSLPRGTAADTKQQGLVEESMSSCYAVISRISAVPLREPVFVM